MSQSVVGREDMADGSFAMKKKHDFEIIMELHGGWQSGGMADATSLNHSLN